ncbi:ABC transporter ATP-binding protein [Bradyrhizobium sp. WSM1253]|uniref:ABC transporter ATP-binding protein n=1 Tax=Bradyrhizobium sp. WSM1253 TaxID=319003 RepID=UPI00025D2953|nr:ABC transporter ATP-binding protein [Bradyrhizobium sp. WSM1253]EIG61327.1 ABC-type nitrate/sulfonate/bicarbonate transport system, ATPase component [Bradyrhizobium sp. WSM1253]
MAQPIVVRHVSKAFGVGKGKIEALQDIDVEVNAGEFVAIVGASGCGKSTLLRLVAGLMAPTNGQILIGGKVVTEPSPGIGIVFQTPVLLPWRNVQQNVQLPLDIQRSGKEPKRIDELLALVGLRGFERSRPYELSGGMQQRVALCRALVTNPSLLLMDEPFGALDALTREQMNLELQRIWIETGKTVLLITHSITESVMLADRVVVMTPRPGRIQEIIKIGLPRPRDFSSLRDPEFHRACERIRLLMNASGLME